MPCSCPDFVCVACPLSFMIVFNFNLVYLFRMSATVFHHGLQTIQVFSNQDKSLPFNKSSHLSPWQRISPNNLRLRPIQVSTPHSSVDNPAQLFENNKTSKPKKKSSKYLVDRDFFCFFGVQYFL